MPGQTPDSAVSKPARPRESPLGLTVRNLLRKRSSRVALFVLGVIVLVGLLAPFIAPYDPAAQPDIVALKDLPPSLAHPFGTDPYSRDVLSRVLYGARLSLTIGVLVAWPHLSIGALVLFLGLTGWFGLSRIVRGQVLALKHAEFVTAARALGASRRRILGRHLLPNLVSPIVVAATLGVAHVIVLEAGLSYLGIGVPQPLASWGNIIQDGSDQIATLWWMALFPGLFMVLTVMMLNILGEALRDTYERR